MKLARYDYAGALVLGERLDSPVWGRSSAIVTPQGYLIVDAYTARDGLLRYSDGKDSWMEYRPRAELEQAAASWQHTPVTDEHPPVMVDAENWTQFARGIHIGPPSLEAGGDGVSFLRAKLLITDADLVREVTTPGGRRELSIGFLSAVRVCPLGVGRDGTRCDAEQSGLVGNHAALVVRGRSGPQVRLHLDGAAYLVPERPLATPTNIQPIPTAAPRGDEIGAPVEQTRVIGPDGVEVMLPTWAAAMIAEAQSSKGGGPPPAPAAPAAPVAPPAPPAPAAAPPKPAAPPLPPGPPAPAGPPPAAAPPGAVPPAPTPEMPPGAPATPTPPGPPMKNPDDEENRDSIAAEVNRQARKRARLERLALKAGVPEDKIDSAETDEELARLFVIAKIPTAPVKELRGDALDALVATAASLKEPETPDPKPKANAGHPWEQPRPRPTGDAAPAANDDDPTVKFMRSQGY